jgi:23S rRNA (guanosine2251-2'-O)-methyltransferase
MKLKAAELRTKIPTEEELARIRAKRRQIYIILDSVMDTYNVGGIFRLADAIGAKKVILCGQTETPPHTRIKKASINTTEWVEWEYAETAVSAIKNLKFKIKNLTVVAIEQSKKSTLYTKIDYKLPLALVVGHETDGVSKEALEAADYIAEIPMWGVNVSLNVIISTAIVSYEAVKQIYK